MCHFYLSRDISQLLQIKAGYITSSTKTKDKPFECVACGQAFATKEELEAHISAIHTTK
jgi:hypothetical protein